jgi:hypothetical protein
MNLGGVYLNVILEIAAYAALTTLLIALLVRWRLGVRKRILIPAALLGWGVAAYAAEVVFHEPLFAVRHRAQNDGIPDIDYALYRPAFNVLRAVGPMSIADLEAWLATHPHLALLEVPPPAEDPFARYFGVDRFDRAFFTPPSADYGQLRLYWKQQQVYIAYNAF